MEEKIDELNRRAGKVLLRAVQVESYLEMLLLEYFKLEDWEKQNMLSDELLIPLKLETKIQILEDICKKEDIEDRKEIIKNIRFLQNIRNKVAHGERYVTALPEAKVKITSRKMFKKKEDEIDLTDELMKEIEDKTKEATKRLIEIQVDLAHKKSKTTEF